VLAQYSNSNSLTVLHSQNSFYGNFSLRASVKIPSTVVSGFGFAVSNYDFISRDSAHRVIYRNDPVLQTNNGGQTATSADAFSSSDFIVHGVYWRSGIDAGDSKEGGSSYSTTGNIPSDYLIVSFYGQVENGWTSQILIDWVTLGVNRTQPYFTFSDNESLPVDTDSPLVYLVSPANNAVFTYNASGVSSWLLNFSFNASDNVAVSNCSLFVNSVLKNVTFSPVNASVTVVYDVNVTANALMPWFVNCTDSAGNQNSSSTWYFYVNTTNASVTPTPPSNGTVININITNNVLGQTNVTGQPISYLPPAVSVGGSIPSNATPQTYNKTLSSNESVGTPLFTTGGLTTNYFADMIGFGIQCAIVLCFIGVVVFFGRLKRG
jgi:hypothetical protein